MKSVVMLDKKKTNMLHTFKGLTRGCNHHRIPSIHIYQSDDDSSQSIRRIIETDRGSTRVLQEMDSDS